MAAANDLRDRLNRAIERDTDVVVDLSGVTLLDCVCLGVLVDGHRRAGLRNRSVSLAAPTRSVAWVLRLTSLDTVFATFLDRDSALAHVGRCRSGDGSS